MLWAHNLLKLVVSSYLQWRIALLEIKEMNLNKRWFCSLVQKRDVRCLIVYRRVRL